MLCSTMAGGGGGGGWYTYQGRLASQRWKVISVMRWWGGGVKFPEKSNYVALEWSLNLLNCLSYRHPHTGMNAFRKPD